MDKLERSKMYMATQLRRMVAALQEGDDENAAQDQFLHALAEFDNRRTQHYTFWTNTELEAGMTDNVEHVSSDCDCNTSALMDEYMNLLEERRKRGDVPLQYELSGPLDI